MCIRDRQRPISVGFQFYEDSPRKADRERQTYGANTQPVSQLSSENAIKLISQFVHAGSAALEEFRQEWIVGVAQGTKQMCRVHGFLFSTLDESDRCPHHLLRGGVQGQLSALHTLVRRQHTSA